MEKGWTKVFRTDKPYQADIVSNILNENNIKSVVINKKDSMYLFGFIEVYVEDENKDVAIEIINKSAL